MSFNPLTFDQLKRWDATPQTPAKLPYLAPEGFTAPFQCQDTLHPTYTGLKTHCAKQKDISFRCLCNKLLIKGLK